MLACLGYRLLFGKTCRDLSTPRPLCLRGVELRNAFVEHDMKAWGWSVIVGVMGVLSQTLTTDLRKLLILYSSFDYRYSGGSPRGFGST